MNDKAMAFNEEEFLRYQREVPPMKETPFRHELIVVSESVHVDDGDCIFAYRYHFDTLKQMTDFMQLSDYDRHCTIRAQIVVHSDW